MKVEYLGPVKLVGHDGKPVEVKCNQVRIKTYNPVFDSGDGDWTWEAVLVCDNNGITAGGKK